MVGKCVLYYVNCWGSLSLCVQFGGPGLRVFLEQGRAYESIETKITSYVFLGWLFPLFLSVSNGFVGGVMSLHAPRPCLIKHKVAVVTVCLLEQHAVLLSCASNTGQQLHPGRGGIWKDSFADTQDLRVGC